MDKDHETLIFILKTIDGLYKKVSHTSNQRFINYFKKTCFCYWYRFKK